MMGYYTEMQALNNFEVVVGVGCRQKRPDEKNDAAAMKIVAMLIEEEVESYLLAC